MYSHITDQHGTLLRRSQYSIPVGTAVPSTPECKYVTSAVQAATTRESSSARTCEDSVAIHRNSSDRASLAMAAQRRQNRYAIAPAATLVKCCLRCCALVFARDINDDAVNAFVPAKPTMPNWRTTTPTSARQSMSSCKSPQPPFGASFTRGKLSDNAALSTSGGDSLAVDHFRTKPTHKPTRRSLSAASACTMRSRSSTYGSIVDGVAYVPIPTMITTRNSCRGYGKALDDLGTLSSAVSGTIAGNRELFWATNRKRELTGFCLMGERARTEGMGGGREGRALLLRMDFEGVEVEELKHWIRR